jgi:Xaa-Pro aminopeptidase
MLTTRLERAQKIVRDNEGRYDGFFISNGENRSYLSGFNGSWGYLLVSADRAIILTDGRYTTQAQDQAPDCEVITLVRPYDQTLAKELKQIGFKRLGFESDHMTVAGWQALNAIEGITWVSEHSPFQALRYHKDANELAMIKRAVEIADSGFSHILNFIKPGLTEREVAAELEFAMRRGGADKIAFETIVVSGVRGALPHGRATDKVIQAGELVTIDFGAHYGGYNCDITRTIAIGHADKDQRERYQVVLEAQLAACAAVKPGAICKEVDAVARNFIKEAGYGEFFVHGLGHSLGREVHEQPMLNWVDEAKLEEGMVLTIEPGIYLPLWGGIRIEDDLYVTGNGAEVLPKSPKELIVV